MKKINTINNQKFVFIWTNNQELLMEINICQSRNIFFKNFQQEEFKAGIPRIQLIFRTVRQLYVSI